MPSQRKLFTALLASAALLASPSAALAQSAGDQQYADPLADTPSKGDSGSGNSGSQGNSGNSGSGTQGTTGSGTTATPSQAAPGTPAQPGAAAQGQALPRTGSDGALLLAAGAILLGSGMLIRVGVTARRGAV
jgi:LPXTG-motif cell wall-anchored protein